MASSTKNPLASSATSPTGGGFTLHPPCSSRLEWATPIEMNGRLVSVASADAHLLRLTTTARTAAPELLASALRLLQKSGSPDSALLSWFCNRA